MNASREDIKNFNIIFEEIKNLEETFNRSHELYKKEFDNDIDLMTAVLQSSENAKEPIQNQVQFFLSSKAQRNIHEIATRQIKQNRLTHELTIDEFVYDIRDSLYLHLMKSKGFDSPSLSSLLYKAYKKAKNRMQERTYFFPFQAPSLRLGQEIHIGDVKIVHKDIVYAEVKQDSYYDLFIKNSGQDIFNCLLCITIPKCSNKMSKIRAQNVANFIYGIVRVFTTLHNIEAKQISLMTNPTKSNIEHYITRNDNKYWIEGSYSFDEDLRDFWNSFEEDLETDLGFIIKKLVWHAIHPNDKECLAERLIDAFYWFGDASRDNNESAQLVKLVTSMERLVTLSIEKNDTGLAKRFCNRVSSLVAIYEGEVDKWHLNAKEIYKLRSDLVHGSEGLSKSYNLNLSFDPFQLTCSTILSSCIGFYTLGLELINYERKLQSLYSELSEIC